MKVAWTGFSGKQGGVCERGVEDDSEVFRPNTWKNGVAFFRAGEDLGRYRFGEGTIYLGPLGLNRLLDTQVQMMVKARDVSLADGTESFETG